MEPLVTVSSKPITQSTPNTAVLAGRRIGGSEQIRPHHLVNAAHQTRKLALDGFIGCFASWQVDLIGP